MKEVNFKPSPGLILVKPIEVKPKETIGKANIYLPEQSKGKADNFNQVEDVFDEWPYQAIVVAIGDALPSIPINWLEIGDIVYLSRELQARDGVIIEKEGYANIRVSDIHGKIGK